MNKRDQQAAARLTAALKTVGNAVKSDRLAAGDAVDLWQMLNELLVKGSVGLRWELHDPALNVRFTEDDLTLGDAEVIKQRCGARVADVELLADATHFAAVLYAWLVNHEGMDSVDASQRVADIPVNRAAECIKTVAVGPDPKEQPVS